MSTPTGDTVSKGPTVADNRRKLDLLARVVGFLLLWSIGATVVLLHNMAHTDDDIMRLSYEVKSLESRLKHAGVTLPETHTWDGIRIVYDDPQLEAIIRAEMKAAAESRAGQWGRHGPPGDQDTDNSLSATKEEDKRSEAICCTARGPGFRNTGLPGKQGPDKEL